MKMDKKSLGLIAAAMLAALTGGAEVLSMGERVDALEALHPELVTEIPAEPEEAIAEPAEPPVEPESTDPAPGEEALELDEDDEWVPAGLDEALEAADEE
tara:strand:- start:107 stop:406 length:300 start_codon:yes stop_codon:yes gene_type:complete